jgi:hypothetical protein
MFSLLPAAANTRQAATAFRLCVCVTVISANAYNWHKWYCYKMRISEGRRKREHSWQRQRNYLLQLISQQYLWDFTILYLFLLYCECDIYEVQDDTISIYYDVNATSNLSHFSHLISLGSIVSRLDWPRHITSSNSHKIIGLKVGESEKNFYVSIIII